ncbi:type II toxin-antitoxin system VapC family toxin [Patulibacter sp. NPDC049589]|uniref:type II toxin-antitoxin system VapC family toxin n=1 Tax=Patulibacter sp. NPDC049589 TaxID=3154731 RepID=UPI003430FD2D
MIVVDTSSLVAIVLGEADAEGHLAAMTGVAVAASAVSIVEAGIVVEARQGPDAARDLELLVEGAIDEILAVDATHARVAHDAWRRFGKGRHPAGLNVGDCFSYAAAVVRDAPLLFKGDDFAQTDLRRVR